MLVFRVDSDIIYDLIMRLTSSAIHVGGHLDGDVEILGLGLGETVGSRHVVGDLEGSLAGGSQRVTSGVHVTLELMISYWSSEMIVFIPVILTV